jgi:hypothetical protein
MSTFLSLLMILRQRYRIVAGQVRMKQHAIPQSQGHIDITQRQRPRNKQRITIRLENRNEPKRIRPTIELKPMAVKIFIGLGSTTNDFEKSSPAPRFGFAYWLHPPAERESWRQNDVARFRNGPFRKAAVKAFAPK